MYIIIMTNTHEIGDHLVMGHQKVIESGSATLSLG